MKKKLFLIAAALILLLPNAEAAKENIHKEIILQNNFYESIDFFIGNFSSPIKLIFSDIDENIVFKSRNSLVYENIKKANIKLENANIPMILVTDKSLADAKIIANKVGLKEPTYIIAHQGAVIVDQTGSTIYQDGIRKKDVDKILRDIESFNKFYYIHSRPFVFANGNLYTFYNFEMPKTVQKPIIIPSTRSIGKDFIATKIGIYEPNKKTLIALQRYLKKHHPKFNITTTDDCICNITSQSANKNNAVSIITQRYGVDFSNVAVFGDNKNDINMLRLVKDNGGTAISFDNSNDYVKSSSNYVTKDIYNNGFLYAIDIILKNNNLLLP